MSNKIFLIEDDKTCESILRKVIESVDPKAEVSWADSAEGALKSLNMKNNYDLIILDVFLSGKKTGIELWKECAKKFPDTPILIISGLPVDHFLKEFTETTITPPFLPKPFFIGECKQMIKGLLLEH